MLPQLVSDIEIAFAGRVSHLMPAMAEIPDGFDSHRNPFNDLACKWFYSGLDAKILREKEGIDRDVAFRHLKTIMNSFEPKHEHKIAGVAYLMSQWFDIVEPAPATATSKPRGKKSKKNR